jgi:hypothetical protein
LSCDRYLPEGMLLPYIPTDLLKSVVFVGYRDSYGEFQFLGSAFWVARLVVDKFDQPHRLAYLVTAAHNVENAKKKSADDCVWLRVNIKGDGPQWVAGTHTGSFATSKDENVDLAVLKIPIDHIWDNIAWPFESLVEDDLLDTENTGDRKVEHGDELIFAGLFHPPDLYAHSCSLQFGAGVGVDFTVQADLFKLRTGPFHGSLLRVP